MCKTMVKKSLMDNLRPEELEPRLEMQILVDPLGMAFQQAENNVNCEDGSNCCAKGGTCKLVVN